MIKISPKLKQFFAQTFIASSAGIKRIASDTTLTSTEIKGIFLLFLFYYEVPSDVERSAGRTAMGEKTITTFKKRITPFFPVCKPTG